MLAVEQLRLRRPEQPWLIPVRLDDCEIPDRDLGGGRMLSSLQRVDLFSEGFDDGVAVAIHQVSAAWCDLGGCGVRRVRVPAGAMPGR